MSRNASWFVPLAVVAACVPCLLLPVTASLIAAGALGGVLGVLGVPWVLAPILAIAIGAALLVVRLRHRAPHGCEIADTTAGLASAAGAPARILHSWRAAARRKT